VVVVVSAAVFDVLEVTSIELRPDWREGGVVTSWRLLLKKSVALLLLGGVEKNVEDWKEEAVAGNDAKGRPLTKKEGLPSGTLKLNCVLLLPQIPRGPLKRPISLAVALSNDNDDVGKIRCNSEMASAVDFRLLKGVGSDSAWFGP
jgi:hypothetical protein